MGTRKKVYKEAPVTYREVGSLPPVDPALAAPLPPTEPAPTVDPASIQKALLEKRLADLQAEYDNGQKTLNSLIKQQKEIEINMLRISGAIQVTQEYLNPPSTG